MIYSLLGVRAMPYRSSETAATSHNLKFYIRSFMRPELARNINPEEFLKYYWLKEELLTFCKEYNISGNGCKQDITGRILHYLLTGDVLKSISKPAVSKRKYLNDLSLDAEISDNYKNDETHRDFFKEVIGVHFKFNIQFMNWMKKNVGKTYRDAVNEWIRIYNEKNTGKKYDISSQFEYNQYTRDFFSANSYLTRVEAIKCWKYKKSLPGTNKYEESDLKILKNDRNSL